MMIDDPAPRIANRIRVEREQRSWSLADLSERSGVSRAMISKIERNEASPTATVLGRLSSVSA
jgi:transcriptional regulator with XRE-family HTH domain